MSCRRKFSTATTIPMNHRPPRPAAGTGANSREPRRGCWRSDRERSRHRHRQQCRRSAADVQGITGRRFSASIRRPTSRRSPTRTASKPWPRSSTAETARSIVASKGQATVITGHQCVRPYRRSARRDAGGRIHSSEPARHLRSSKRRTFSSCCKTSNTTRSITSTCPICR